MDFSLAGCHSCTHSVPSSAAVLTCQWGTRDQGQMGHTSDGTDGNNHDVLPVVMNNSRHHSCNHTNRSKGVDLQSLSEDVH